MCNRYRNERAIAALFGDLQNWREEKEILDDHGRNMPPPFEVFPNLPGRIITARDNTVRITEALWGMPTPAEHLVTKTGKKMAHDPGVTNIRKTFAFHWRPWLEPANRCLVPFTTFCENAPVTYAPTWFGFSDGRPVGYFAGVHDTLTRQIKAKDLEPTTADFFAFLTTNPNAEVMPIHPKAMPVILTTEEEMRTWLYAPWAEAKKLQRPLPDGALTIVGRGNLPVSSTAPESAS